MVVVIIGMLVCIVLALLVVGIVALPARRQGDGMLLDRSRDRAVPPTGEEPAAGTADAPAAADAPEGAPAAVAPAEDGARTR